MPKKTTEFALPVTNGLENSWRNFELSLLNALLPQIFWNATTIFFLVKSSFHLPTKIALMLLYGCFNDVETSLAKNKMNILCKTARYAQKFEWLLNLKNLPEIPVEQYWVMNWSIFSSKG